MAKLGISSGTISMSSLRTHFSDTDSISMSDFRAGGNKLVNGSSAGLHTNHGGNMYATTHPMYFVRVRTIQNATQGDGGGTVTTGYNRYYMVGGYGNTVPRSNTPIQNEQWKDNLRTHNLHGKGAWPAGRATGMVERGPLQSAGSYSAWENNIDAKGNTLGSDRFKDDFYSIKFANTTTPEHSKLTRASLNSTVPSSGSIGMDDLYEIDNGIVWEGSITVGTGTNNAKGYNDGTISTGLGTFGSVSNANISQIDGVLESDKQNQIILANFQNYYFGTANTTLYFGFRAARRNAAAGTISNTANNTNITSQRYSGPRNFTGLGYTNTTAVWTYPNSVSSRDNYARRSISWSNPTDNSVGNDNGAGWLLPTDGPTLLQVRAEKETTHPKLTNVRFTPTSQYRGRTVIIQCMRTKRGGGFNSFYCNGAASGNFSGLSNSNGQPLERAIVLPSSGYVQFGATATESYGGTIRYLQITIYDPFYVGMSMHGNVIGSIEIDGTEYFDVTQDMYNSNSTTTTGGSIATAIQYTDTSNATYQTLKGTVNNCGYTFPSAGNTINVKIKR